MTADYQMSEMHTIIERQQSWTKGKDLIASCWDGSAAQSAAVLPTARISPASKLAEVASSFCTCLFREVASVVFTYRTKRTSRSPHESASAASAASYAQSIRRERPQIQDLSWRFCLTKFNLV
jgi:hypothetical protein